MKTIYLEGFQELGRCRRWGKRVGGDLFIILGITTTQNYNPSFFPA